ncbi:MAG: hypothetical protein IK087_02390, partial [Lachnospiraceae bacterium]|nr:hypothetical protein [Lachnospiraceae bacterium]
IILLYKAWVIWYNRGRSPSDIGRDVMWIIVNSLLTIVPYIFTIFIIEGIISLLDHPGQKVEQNTDIMKTAHSNFEKETSLADVEALYGFKDNDFILISTFPTS